MAYLHFFQKMQSIISASQTGKSIICKRVTAKSKIFWLKGQCFSKALKTALQNAKTSATTERPHFYWRKYICCSRNIIINSSILHTSISYFYGLLNLKNEIQAFLFLLIPYKSSLVKPKKNLNTTSTSTIQQQLQDQN